MLRIFVFLAAASLSTFCQEASEFTVGKVAAGYRFTTSPLWVHEGYWLFSDVPANNIIQLTPGQKPEVFIENTQGASGIALDSQGRLYVCESRGRRVVRIDKKKRTDVVADKWQGKRLNAPNDVVVRKDGNVYFSDPAFGYQQDSRDLDFFGVFRITPKGELELVAKSTSRPNGVALSPNGRTLYVSDSDRRLVRAYDLDRNGAASNERNFVTGVEGVPAGLCVDEKGNVYVAAKWIQVYTADGKPSSKVELAERPSSCGFGDPDLQSMFVTAGPSVYRVRWK